MDYRGLWQLFSSTCCPAHPAPEPFAVDLVQGQMIEPASPTLLGAGGGKARGKGDAKVDKASGGGKARGKGEAKVDKASKWQIMLDGKWTDYGAEEDRILKRAYMMGHKNAKFHLRGQNYEYNFKKMLQRNYGTKKERQIRPPFKSLRPPKKPLLPSGPMIINTVGMGQPGSMISVKDPNNPGTNIQVYVPPHAQPGQKMAVPIPQHGETVESVQKKQQTHDAVHGTKASSWSTGGKITAGCATVAGLAAVGVGGVILGDHLAGGDMADTIGEAAVDVGEAMGDGVTDAIDAIGDWAPGAAEDVGDWFAGAAADAGDWLGDAGEDIGDFVMDLF